MVLSLWTKCHGRRRCFHDLVMSQLNLIVPGKLISVLIISLGYMLGDVASILTCFLDNSCLNLFATSVCIMSHMFFRLRKDAIGRFRFGSALTPT